MKLGEIATKVRSLTNTDTSSYTDANLLIDINIWYQTAALMAMEAGDDVDFDDSRIGSGGSAGSTGNYPIKITPLKASQRDYNIPISEKVLKIKRVDVCYDGINSYRAEPFDSGQTPYGIKFSGSSSLDPTFDKNFIKQAPAYDVAYNSIFLFPCPDASDEAASGFVRVEWERNVIPFTTADYTSVLTDSTAVPGIDDPFHPLIAYGAAFEYATSRQLPQIEPITAMLQDYRQRLASHYGRKEWDRRYTLQPDTTVTYR